MLAIAFRLYPCQRLQLFFKCLKIIFGVLVKQIKRTKWAYNFDDFFTTVGLSDEENLTLGRFFLAATDLYVLM